MEVVSGIIRIEDNVDGCEEATLVLELLRLDNLHNQD